MSQDAQEGQGFGSPGFAGRRAEDIKASIEGERRMLEELGKLASYEPDVVAQGVKALSNLQDKVAEVRHEPWTAEQKLEWLRSACDIIAHAKGGEAVTAAISGITPAVFEHRAGVVAWNPEQKQGFMEALQREGLIPPPSPTAPPTPGGIPPAGK